MSKLAYRASLGSSLVESVGERIEVGVEQVRVGGQRERRASVAENRLQRLGRTPGLNDPGSGTTAQDVHAALRQVQGLDGWVPYPSQEIAIAKWPTLGAVRPKCTASSEVTVHSIKRSRTHHRRQAVTILFTKSSRHSSQISRSRDMSADGDGGLAWNRWLRAETLLGCALLINLRARYSCR